MLSDKRYSSSFSEAQNSYQVWKSLDPYPDIPPALLNSADIKDYVRVTGMIYPFHEEDIKGATYSVRLKGLCVHFVEDQEGNVEPTTFRVGEDALDLPNAVKNEKRYEAREKLVLKPNSITYVTLEPVFQVPEYLVFRFNLKIPHVYKGLLLGTGPIIDPGFQGRLSLPLHNLTSNEYVLDLNDEVISLEVTKMSPIRQWQVCRVRDRWAIHTPTEIPGHRQVDEYIRSALRGNSKKHVVSSITTATGEARRIAENARNDVGKLTATLRNTAVVGALAIVVAVATLVVNLLVPTYQLVESVRGTQTGYEGRLNDLQDEIEDLKMLLKKYGIEEELS